jgi:hypothetical protein
LEVGFEEGAVRVFVRGGNKEEGGRGKPYFMPLLLPAQSQ